MANNLKAHLKEVADAIRAKKGTSDLINPQDFATEIEGISGGGSGEGASTIEYEYYALSDGWGTDLDFTFPYLSYLVKTTISGEGTVIAPPLLAKVINGNQSVTPVAVAVDMSLIINIGGQLTTIKDAILGAETTEENLAKYRITKEQFYDLNA